jgi:hypothetical protein
MLQASEATIVVASSVKESLEAFARHQPDIRDLDFNQAITMGFRRFLACPIKHDHLTSAITLLIGVSN